jgi:hypothetical protein
MSDRRPVESLVRSEAPPDAAVVVVRGGPIAAQKVAEHAQRQEALFTFRGQPMVAISVDLTAGAGPSTGSSPRGCKLGAATPAQWLESCVPRGTSWSPLAARPTTA